MLRTDPRDGLHGSPTYNTAGARERQHVMRAAPDACDEG